MAERIHVGGPEATAKLLSGFTASALAHRNHGAAIAFVTAAHILGDLAQADRVFGNVDQMRGVLVFLSGQTRRCRQPASVAAHNLHELDGPTFPHSLRVSSRVTDGHSHETSRTPIAGAVIREGQIVIYRLGNADDSKVVPSLLGQRVHLVGRIHGVVAADIEEIANIVGPENLENALVVVFRQFVPDGS